LTAKNTDECDESLKHGAKKEKTAHITDAAPLFLQL
jgi:hypothetical protein